MHEVLRPHELFFYIKFALFIAQTLFITIAKKRVSSHWSRFNIENS